MENASTSLANPPGGLGAGNADVSSRDFFDSPTVRNSIFALFAILLIVPIWMVKYPPLVDYPDHLARAFILHHLNDTHYDFGRWFAPDWGPNPYFMADALMQVLLKFVGIYTAGKLLMTLCLVGLPFSALFFLKRANPGSEYLALWGFVIAYNPNFLMGFMSFTLSISLCFVVVGVWLDFVRTQRVSTWVLALALATMLFLTHLGGFGVAGLALTVYTLATAGIGWRLLQAELIFAPGVAFFLWAKLHGWAGRGMDYNSWHLIPKIRSMLTEFQGYSKSVEFVSLAALAAIVLYFVVRRDKLKVQAPWIFVVLAIVAVHWIVPDRYGDLAFIDYRFCIFAFLFALAIPVFRGPKNWIITLTAAVFLVHLANVGSHFVSVQKKLEAEAADFKLIPDHSLVLAYTCKGKEPWVESTALHFWAYGVIDGGWISPSLFHQKDVQPLQLREPMSADDDEYGDGLVRSQYTVETIQHDYDYVWARNVGYLQPYLDKIGEPVAADGGLRIYKSKDLTATSGWNANHRWDSQRECCDSDWVKTVRPPSPVNRVLQSRAD